MILTVIGGGSVNWMRGVMKDFYLLEGVDGGEIRLVDPNRETVEAVEGMLRRFNEQRNKDFAISIVDDRREALKGSEFVLLTFSPGAMDAFYNDLEIPIKYGIRQPVSMTVGPSGISASIRTAPVAYEIVEEMEQVCPGAWVLNETNPMSVVTRALNLPAKETKVLGLCHGLHALPGILGPALGMKVPEGMDILTYLYTWLGEQGFDYTFAGINHFIFLTKASRKGVDVLPRIRKFCEEKSGSELISLPDEELATEDFENHYQAAMAICKQVGYFPINHDRHTIEFLPTLCNFRNGFGMKYGVKKTTVDARRFSKARQLEEIRKIGRGEMDMDWKGSGEELVHIVEAIIHKGSYKTVVNAPNKGQISNLPPDVVVETVGFVSGKGVEPVPAGELPGVIASWCRLHVDVQELTLKAALEGSRDLLIQALSLDPLSAGVDFAEIGHLADELLMSNREWLPRFFN